MGLITYNNASWFKNSSCSSWKSWNSNNPIFLLFISFFFRPPPPRPHPELVCMLSFANVVGTMSGCSRPSIQISYLYFIKLNPTGNICLISLMVPMKTVFHLALNCSQMKHYRTMPGYEGQTLKPTLNKNWNYLVCVLVIKAEKKKKNPWKITIKKS